MATPFVAGNWKMNTTISEAIKLARELRPALVGIDGVTRLVCPPFVSLAGVSAEFVGSDIHVGAQNMHSEAKGAFTGEVSGPMLKDVCEYVIVGHSERRQLRSRRGRDSIGQASWCLHGECREARGIA